MIICGDAREHVAAIKPDAVITDPVWPNCPPDLLIGDDRPYELLAETLDLLAPTVDRIVEALA